MSADQIEDTGQGPGWDLPGYRLGRLLGRGGFASVYEAEQISLGRQVAVKVLMTDLGSDSDRRRFDRERTILARLSEHPSVIDVHDAGISAEGRPYIVMRLYRHGSLTNRLSADGPLPPATVATLIGHVAAALDAAHGIGVLHRDVKPSNILLTDNGQPVLADFGISLLQDAHAATGATSTTFFSLAYAAPEILEDTLFSTSSDIYGLAATAFAALAAAHPFDATDPRTASRILDGPPPELDPALPAAVRDAVRHGMARDPGDRPATATDFAIELARAAEAEPPAPPAGSWPSIVTSTTGPAPDTATTAASALRPGDLGSWPAPRNPPRSPEPVPAPVPDPDPSPSPPPEPALSGVEAAGRPPVPTVAPDTGRAAGEDSGAGKAGAVADAAGADEVVGPRPRLVPGQDDTTVPSRHTRPEPGGAAVPGGPPPAPSRAPVRQPPVGSDQAPTEVSGVIPPPYLGSAPDPVFPPSPRGAAVEHPPRAPRRSRRRRHALTGSLVILLIMVATGTGVSWFIRSYRDPSDPSALSTSPAPATSPSVTAADGRKTVSATDLASGDCVESDFRDVVATLVVVSCADPHRGEVIGDYRVEGSTFPGADTLSTEAKSRCLAMRPDGVQDTLKLMYLIPSKDTWSLGDRKVSCLLFSETTVTAPFQ